MSSYHWKKLTFSKLLFYKFKIYFAINEKNYKIVTPKCWTVDKSKILIKQSG